MARSYSLKSRPADPEVSAISFDYVRPGQNQMITSRGRAWKVRNATVAVSGSTGLDVATHPQAVVRQIAASIDVVGLSGGGLLTFNQLFDPAWVAVRGLLPT